MIRVLLIDDDPNCREGLLQLLSLADDLQVVGAVESAVEALELSRSAVPDVVVIDADLPSDSCIAAIRELTGGAGPGARPPACVCLAVYPDRHDAAIQAGATHFLRKDGSRAELLRAIRQAARARATRQGDAPTIEGGPVGG